jgi:Beta-glucan synthesis-associated protein SKN1/KRE6/Sbg1
MIFLCPVDNKLSLVSRSFPLTFSRVQEGIFIPLVCPGFISFSGIFSSGHAGFEYFANPQSRSDGYVTWMMDDNPTVRMGAAAVGPDQGPNGSGVSQRLIPEEPMVWSCPSFTLTLLILALSSP